MDSPDPELTQYSDAIVRYADAGVWAEELFPMKSSVLTERLLHEEPALVAVSVNLGLRMEQRAINLGVPPSLAAKLAEHVVHCGLVAAELTRRGYRKFIAETGDDAPTDSTDPEKENNHD